MTSLSETIRGLVAALLQEHGAAVDGARLAGDLDLLEAGIIDSTSFLELVASLEERLNVEIDFLEVDPAGMTTLDGLTATLERLKP